MCLSNNVCAPIYAHVHILMNVCLSVCLYYVNTHALNVRMYVCMYV